MTPTKVVPSVFQSVFKVCLKARCPKKSPEASQKNTIHRRRMPSSLRCYRGVKEYAFYASLADASAS